MFAYPPKAAVNRPVAKAKIYAHSKPTKRVRELFISQVSEIIWKYKLSPETTNLPAQHGIQEVQVFEIDLKTPEVDTAVLEAIDKAIPFPILFRLVYGDRVRFSASYKRPSESGTSKWVIESVFQSEWQPKGGEGPPLPIALDLASLYEKILRAHIPLPERAGETIADHIARFGRLQNSKRLHSQLQTKLAQEKQFNRKVELNAQLRELTDQLTDLQR